MVIYDGRSLHGVADIDPLLDLDMATLSGRVAALVSLFKYLAPDVDEYAEMARKAEAQFGAQ